MGDYYSCLNCGNEEPGTNLYLCPNAHRYCHACAEIIIYDMLRIICPVCKKDHKEIYGTIARDDNDGNDFDDDNIDDFIDDDIHDYADGI
jgi:hypothetical protein